MKSDEGELLSQQTCGDNDEIESPQPPINQNPLFPLIGTLPTVVARLKTLLTEVGESELAATVDELYVYDRCRCGADHCATVYTKPRPLGGYGFTLRNVVLETGDTVGAICGMTQYTIILDVVHDEIACIEILQDWESRHRLLAALPDDAEPQPT